MIQEHHGRKFDGKEHSVFPSSGELTMGFSSSLPLGDEWLKPRVITVNQSLPAFPQNFLASASEHSARRRVRIKNFAIRTRQHEAFETVLEQQAIESFTVWKKTLLGCLATSHEF